MANMFTNLCNIKVDGYLQKLLHIWAGEIAMKYLFIKIYLCLYFRGL